MTKYEWESELKKGIHRLPADELKRVMEYYDELFADMIERGKGECEIIAEFGNPVDVAYKILSEYDGELKETEEAVLPPVASAVHGEESAAPVQKNEQTESMPPVSEIPLVKEESPSPVRAQKKSEESGGLHGDRLVLFIVLNVLTGFAFFIVAGAVWIVLGALMVSGVAMAVGGVAATAVSFMPMFDGYMASGAAQLGIGVALSGAGILLAAIMVWEIKVSAKLTAGFFRGLKNWLTAKRRAYEKN